MDKGRSVVHDTHQNSELTIVSRDAVISASLTGALSAAYEISSRSRCFNVNMSDSRLIKFEYLL